jgi:hypothetical protein
MISPKLWSSWKQPRRRGVCYVLGGAGLFDVNRRNGAVRRLGDGSFHGQLG